MIIHDNVQLYEIMLSRKYYNDSIVWTFVNPSNFKIKSILE